MEGGGVLICCWPQAFDLRPRIPFEFGEPFLVLLETPSTFGRSVRFFHILHGKKKRLPYLLPVWQGTLRNISYPHDEIRQLLTFSWPLAYLLPVWPGALRSGGYANGELRQSLNFS